MTSGTINVRTPNIKLLCLFLENSRISSSKPAKNIIYKSPIVEKSVIADVFSIMFRACGPITTPEIIKPIMAGTFSLRKKIGENSITNSSTVKTKTGLPKGVLK